MNQNPITFPVSVIIAGLLIAVGIYMAAPRYEIVPISTTTNPGVWKLDRYNGNIFLCATATGKDSESGCTAKFKQF